MDEKFKVTLELVTTKFKQAANEASGIAKQFSDRVKQDFKGISDALAFRARVRREDIGQVKKEIELLKSNLQKDLELPVHLKMSDAERGQLKSDLQYAEKQLEKLENQANKTSNSVSKIGKSGSLIGNEISKAFTKGLKSVKRLTLGFLGARTAFSLFRRYMSEYQSQNDEFAQKMQLTTNVIVNALAPAFEFFGNIIQYVVIGLARIIELLTGIPILGKATDTALKGVGQSAKELNDNLSGLDEISNIQEDSGGLSTGIGDQLKALSDFQKKIAEVDAWLKKTGIKDYIEKIGEGFRTLWNAFKNQPEWLKWLEIGAGTIGILLGKAGGTTGLFGIALVLSTIAAINIKTIADAWDELLKTTKENEKAADDLIKKWEDLNKKTPDVVEKLNESNAQEVFTKFDGMIDVTFDNLNKKLKDLDKYKHFPFRTDPNKKTDKKLLDQYVKQLTLYLDYEEEAYKQGKLSEEQEEKYRKTLEKSKEMLGKVVKEGYDYNTELNRIQTNLINLDGLNPEATITLKADTSQAKRDLREIVEFMQNTVGARISNIGNIFKLPSYDVGTDYVPRDQIALVHEGERIIPKQYNNADYLGQLGNSETNALLMELNRSILEFANRPQTFNVNGKELAKVTYGDYQEEGSRRGTNTSVRRV